MEALLDPIFRAQVDTGALPGVAAIALDRDGSVLFSKGYGSTDTSNPAAPTVTPETPMTLFSCTKLITVVAALQLVEQGKLDLDALAESYVSEIRDIDLLNGFKADGTPELTKPKNKITIMHLLTHTSGFSYDFFDKETFRWRLAAGQAPMQYAVTATKRDFSSPLVSEPGEKYTYGIGIDWIAFIIESITGMRLDVYAAQHITGPLGLSTIGASLTEAQNTNFLNIHAKEPLGDGKYNLTPTPLRLPNEPEVLSGGHGLYGSAADYAQFLLTILNGGTHPVSHVKILEPATVKSYLLTDMLPRVQAPSDGVGTIEGAIPQASNNGELLPGVKKGWTLGAMTNLQDAPSGRKAGSIAWAGLSNCYYWVDPVDGKLGCVFSATLPFVDNEVLGLLDALERAVYGLPQAKEFGEKGSGFSIGS